MVRFRLAWITAVRRALVCSGRANRSRTPKHAARTAPITPTPISHSDPWARNPAGWTAWEAMSKTRLVTQAPIGTVTKIGCSGCPYVPASTVTGCLAWYCWGSIRDLLFS